MKIDTDTRAFGRALDDFRKATKKDLAAAIREQAKLFVRDILDLMKPESGPKGKKNVARDIARVFTTPKKDASGPKVIAEKAVNDREYGTFFAAKFKNQKIKSRLDTLIMSGRQDALATMLANGIVKGSQAPSINRIDPGIHAAAKRKGVVPFRAGGKAVVFTGKPALLRAYIKAVQERVGQAKGGWGEAAAALGVKLPAFVQKHASGRGSVKFVDTALETSVTIINRDPAAVAQDAQFNISNRVHDMRVNAMESITERILARNAAKASAEK